MEALSKRLRERTFESEERAKLFVSHIWNPALGREEYDQLIVVAVGQVDEGLVFK